MQVGKTRSLKHHHNAVYSRPQRSACVSTVSIDLFAGGASIRPHKFDNGGETPSAGR